MCYYLGDMEYSESHSWVNFSSQESKVDNVDEWPWEFSDEVHRDDQKHIHKIHWHSEQSTRE